MARPEKVASVEEIRRKLGSASAAVLTEYRGLKVGELAALRASLRAADAEYKVFKNTLARRAAQEAGMPELAELLSGPTAITFVKGDAVSVAKALREFGKTNPLLVVKGGLLGDRVINPANVNALADIEPREVLLAKIAGAMQAPLVKAAGLFQALPRSMAYGIKALIDQRVAAGESAPPPAEAAEAPAAQSEPTAAGSEPEGPEAAADAAEPPAAEAPAEAAAPVPAAEGATEAEAAAPVPAADAAEAATEAEAAAPVSADAAQEAPTAAATDGPSESAEAAETPAEAAPSEEATE